MLRLYILRHAKSSWALPGMKDYDRGLDERGAADAPRIAAAMRERGYLPPRILCSPAVRTRMTLHGIMHAYDDPPVVDYSERLYGGDVDDYWSILQDVQHGEPVMIIGHNPMCETLCAQAVRGGEEEAMQRMQSKFPTGTLAVIDFPAGQWQEVRPRTGNLRDFMIPREL